MEQVQKDEMRELQTKVCACVFVYVRVREGERGRGGEGGTGHRNEIKLWL